MGGLLATVALTDGAFGQDQIGREPSGDPAPAGQATRAGEAATGGARAEAVSTYRRLIADWDRDRPSYRRWAWASFGTGAALVGLGAWMAFSAQDDQKEVMQAYQATEGGLVIRVSQSRASALETSYNAKMAGAWVSIPGGAALVWTAVVLVMLEPRGLDLPPVYPVVWGNAGSDGGLGGCRGAAVGLAARLGLGQMGK